MVLLSISLQWQDKSKGIIVSIMHVKCYYSCTQNTMHIHLVILCGNYRCMLCKVVKELCGQTERLDMCPSLLKQRFTCINLGSFLVYYVHNGKWYPVPQSFLSKLNDTWWQQWCWLGLWQSHHDDNAADNESDDHELLCCQLPPLSFPNTATGYEEGAIWHDQPTLSTSVCNSRRERRRAMYRI